MATSYRECFHSTKSPVQPSHREQGRGSSRPSHISDGLGGSRMGLNETPSAHGVRGRVLLWEAQPFSPRCGDKGGTRKAPLSPHLWRSPAHAVKAATAAAATQARKAWAGKASLSPSSSKGQINTWALGPLPVRGPLGCQG